jgi:hypothetical protein
MAKAEFINDDDKQWVKIFSKIMGKDSYPWWWT